MSIIMLAAAAAAAMTTATPSPGLSHQVRHSHQGRTITADYSGTVDISLKQRGMAGAPGRMGTQICDWNAAVHVARSVDGAENASLGGRTVLTGNRAGDCLTVASGIERDVARRHGQLRDHVVRLAEADRPGFTSEQAAGGGEH